MPAAKFSLEDLDDDDDEDDNTQAAPASDLLSFDDSPAPGKPQTSPGKELWDPFGSAAPAAQTAAAANTKSPGAWDPFGGDSGNPFADPTSAMGGFGQAGVCVYLLFC